MRNLKLKKKLISPAICGVLALAASMTAYANSQALPNAAIENLGGISYLVSPEGKKYSGWFLDSSDDWYYFNESNHSMKTSWHHDGKDGYWYYLNPSNGKMLTGWQDIDGKEYFFQPVRDMGNYNFNNEQEKWLYTLNSKVPYGAMYVNTITPDGSRVDENGVKVAESGHATVDWSQYVGVYDLWGGDGPGYQMIITSVTDNRISGAYVQIFDNASHEGRYAEFNVPLSNGKFTVTGTTVKMQMGAAYEITGWSGVTGSFSQEFELTAIDGAKAVTDGSYASYGTYLRRTGGLSAGADGFWALFHKVDGTSWKSSQVINYADILDGAFIYAEGEEYEAYLLWKENEDTVLNDSRIDVYWTETDFYKNEFSITAEQGVAGHALISGTLVWTGNDTATMRYGRDGSSGSSELKVLDANTIEIDGEKLIRIR